jgi:hypothetical protein
VRTEGKLAPLELTIEIVETLLDPRALETDAEVAKGDLEERGIREIFPVEATRFTAGAFRDSIVTGGSG